MVELARSRAISEKLGNVSILESRLEQFPGLISSPVDVIICSSVIEYLSDPDSFVEACYAVLRPGGSLILSVPNGASIYRWAETFIFHFTKRPLYRAFVKAVEPPRVMAARLRRAGFELQSTSYFGRIALLSLLLRAVGRAAAMDTMALFVARKP
jgi:2-polyprenyl-6-hydroxyphenyl methylase/3-demethylubiquinone-9 3-methyltransferase